MPSGIYQHKSRPLSDRLWESVDVRGVDECWPCTLKATDGKMGYRKIWVNEVGHQQFAHRLVWEITFGPIPDTLLVLHTCDNPPCCNPKHLFLGSDLDNTHDKISKGREKYVLGSMVGAAVLTEDDIPLIRAMIRAGQTQKDIAYQFQVGQTTISNIKLGKVWSHVPECPVETMIGWEHYAV